MPEVLATVRTSPARWAVGVAIQALLGFILLWVAVAYPPAELGWTVFLLGCGILAFWGAWRSYHGGKLSIEMTDEAITDSAGTVLCRIDEIERVDRSVFAFKPARGFLLVLKEPRSRVWIPGLWWRFGRRLGVGGATSSAETRFMAEIIEARISGRF